MWHDIKKELPIEGTWCLLQCIDCIVQITPKPTPIYEIIVSDKQSQRNVLRVFNDQGIDTNNSFIVNFDEKYIEAGEGYIIKTDNITSVQIIN